MVPTYNERENIEPLLSEIFARQPAFSVLFVDDGSPDGTGEIVARWAAKDPRVSLLRRSAKDGLGPAYIAGFEHALADRRKFTHIFEMDADLSHDPRQLGALLAKCQPGCAEVVAGSRYLPGGGTPGWPWHRRLISRLGGAYARTLLSLPLSDPTAGFVCFQREVLERVDLAALQSRGYGFQIELKLSCSQAGFSLAEHPIVFHDRTRGESKMGGGIIWEAMRVVWKLRRDSRRATQALPS